MTEPAMRPTDADPAAFLAAVEPAARRTDGESLRTLFERISGEPAVLWGSSILGFGAYHYVYASGREGDAPRIAFSPRKAHLVLYLGGYDGFDADLAGLGKHKRSVACLYVNRLADLDLATLERIVARSWQASATAPGC